MIQDLMRKHRRPVLWFIIVLMVGPFILWGGYSGIEWGRGEKSALEQGLIVSSPEAVVSVEQFQQAMYQERARMAQMGREPSLEEMLANGTALHVLEALVSRELIAREARAQGFDLDKAYLSELKRQMPDFKDQDGKFDARAWNEAVERKDINWNAIYASVHDQLSQQLLLERLMASGRVLDSELKRQFERENTKLSLKYVKIQPKIEPTEEQIKAAYDQNPEAYNLPEKRRADFVAISIDPPKPELADELVKRARAGEDFATLAKEYSQGDTKDAGGDIGWVAEGFALPDHQKVLFTLGKGEIGDPVEGPAGYYIYKVDDERTNDISGQREVKASEIVLHASLDPQELKARAEKADALDAKAKETGDLAAAAAEAGLEVRHSGLFSIDSLSIENVPADDARVFRANLSKLGDGEMSGVITARKNLYVAKIVELQPAQPQPLDAVRERVTQQAKSNIRRSPEYQKQVDELVKDIQAKAKSVSDVPGMFPELGATVEAAPEFSLKDFKFGSGPLWDPREVYALVGDKDPGSLAGPVADLLGDTYFLEVESRTPPGDKAWQEEWPKEEKSLREMGTQRARQARLEDRLMEMRERTPLPVDQAAFMEALGLNQPDAATTDRQLESGEAGGSAVPESLPAGEAAPSAPAEAAPSEAPAEAPAPAAAQSPVPAESSGAAATPPAESPAR